MPAPVRLLLVVAILWSGAAEAQDRVRARSLYDEAIQLFQRGDHQRAVTKFEESNRLYPHPTILYNLGECYRKLNRLRISHRYYQRYSDTLRGVAKQAFARKLEDLRWGTPSQVAIRSRPGGASVLVDGAEVGRTSTSEDGPPLQLTLSGGTHELLVRLGGSGVRRRKLLLEFGEPGSVEVWLEAPRDEPDPARPRPRPRRTRGRWGAFALVLLGPALGSYGGERGTAVDPELGLRAGASRRWGRFGLQLDLALLAVPVTDRPDGRSWFVNVLAGAGLLYHFGPGLFAGPRVALGPSLLLGATAQSFAFTPPPGSRIVEFESGVFPGLLLRPELVLGWSPRTGVAILLSPLAVDVAPVPARDSAEGFRVLRFHFAVGVGWQHD